MNKVVIVGCGYVGMSFAYAMAINGCNIEELVLIDINKKKAEGEAMDLNHAMSYAPKNFKVYAEKLDIYADDQEIIGQISNVVNKSKFMEVICEKI